MFATAFAASASLWAAQPLFKSATESKWSVVDASKKPVATATLTTDGVKSRVDWTGTDGRTSVFIARDGKTYVRGNSGDLELGAYKGAEKALVAPLLDTAAPGAKATADAKGPAAIAFSINAQKYTYTRTSVSKSTATEALYTVTAKTSKLASLKNSIKGAGGLLGSSDSTASTSAAAKGVDPATAMKYGVDLTAVDKLMAQDAQSQEARAVQLKKFQKDGKVGGGQ
jgi:hypothetical protein